LFSQAQTNESIRTTVEMNHKHLELLVTREMPYGKYKGRLIADLPGRYRPQGLPARRAWAIAGADAGAGSQRAVIAA
jgi:hypothetical protein